MYLFLDCGDLLLCLLVLDLDLLLGLSLLCGKLLLVILATLEAADRSCPTLLLEVLLCIHREDVVLLTISAVESDRTQRRRLLGLAARTTASRLAPAIGLEELLLRLWVLEHRLALTTFQHELLCLPSLAALATADRCVQPLLREEVRLRIREDEG